MDEYNKEPYETGFYIFYILQNRKRSKQAYNNLFIARRFSASFLSYLFFIKILSIVMGEYAIRQYKYVGCRNGLSPNSLTISNSPV